jgi:hypothetical protein
MHRSFRKLASVIALSLPIPTRAVSAHRAHPTDQPHACQSEADDS